MCKNALKNQQSMASKRQSKSRSCTSHLNSIENYAIQTQHSQNITSESSKSKQLAKKFELGFLQMTQKSAPTSPNFSNVLWILGKITNWLQYCNLVIDRWWTDKSQKVKNSIQNSGPTYE